MTARRKQRPSAPAMAGPESGVNVRMYRPGALGDCFLLAFPGADGAGSHVLIDCGSLADTQRRRKRLREIVGDIEQACGGRLDLVVVTHPHWDHLSGFHFGREVFDRLRVDKVWLPWTADPGNAKAVALADGQYAVLRVLHAAVAELRQTDDAIGDAVASVLEQWGELGKRSGRPETEQQLRYLRRLGEKAHYLEGPKVLAGPEAPEVPAGLVGVRFHVLGPAADLAPLNRANPLDANATNAGSLLGQANANLAAALDLDVRGKRRRQRLQEASVPFDSNYRVALREAEKDSRFGDFYAKRYGADSRSRAAPAWRRLESDFLMASSDLVTKLDTDVDNASLALAIELPDGQVLLFPGDAQLAAWGSWQVSRPDGPETPMADLLRRTVLYKLSHHGGQDGMPLQGGLELMTHPDLVAIAPVDERQAKERSWSLPFGPTLEALGRQMKQPILRADRRLVRNDPRVKTSSEQAGRDRLLRRIRQRRLWIEVEIR